MECQIKDVFDELAKQNKIISSEVIKAMFFAMQASSMQYDEDGNYKGDLKKTTLWIFFIDYIEKNLHNLQPKNIEYYLMQGNLYSQKRKGNTFQSIGFLGLGFWVIIEFLGGHFWVRKLH